MTAGRRPAASAFTLGGEPEATALHLVGRTVSYAELGRRVEQRARGLSGLDADPLATVDATGLDVTAALVTVFAAAAARRPVLIADPAAGPSDLNALHRGTGLPAGAFLVVGTSGTAGRPRRVTRTAASWTASFPPFTTLTGLRSTDRILLTGPLHGTLHLFAAVHALWLGAELTDRPDRATAVHAVPAVLADLLAAPDTPRQRPERADGLRIAVTAGAALPPATAQLARSRGIALTEYYGATELSIVAARRPPDSFRAFPGVEITLRERTVWVRSPYLSLGYLPGSAAGPFRRDPDGFATVGDLADLTPDGRLALHGRGDAAITTGGVTVVAEDVEAAIAAIPGVAGVAVVGTPHRRLGQVVTAVVEPTPGADLAAVRASARHTLRGATLPRRWWRCDALPRTTAGKVARAVVAAWVLDDTARVRPGGLRPLA